MDDGGRGRSLALGVWVESMDGIGRVGHVAGLVVMRHLVRRIVAVGIRVHEAAGEQ